MPEFLSPGVFIEEVDAGPKPIEGVSTSTAGAVGVTAFGPTSGTPVLVTSFAEFVRTFGGFVPEPAGDVFNRWAFDPLEGGRWWRFALSVKGFFDNGGQRLFVKRVFARTATPASQRFGKGLVADVVADAAANSQEVSLSSLIGLSTLAPNNEVHFFRGDRGDDPKGAEIGTGFTVTSYDPKNQRIRLNAPLPEALVASRGDRAEIHHPVEAGTTDPDPKLTLRFEARSRGKWGNALSARVRPGVGATLRLLPDPAISGNGAVTITTVKSSQTEEGVTTVQLTDPAGFAVNDHVQIQGVEYKLTNRIGTTTDTFGIDPDLPGQGHFDQGAAVRRLRRASTGTNTIRAAGAANLYPHAIVELDNGREKESFTVVSINGDVVELSDPVVKDYFEGHPLLLVEAAVTVRFTPVGGTLVEENFSGLRLFNDGSLSFLVNHIQARSALVTVTAGQGLTSDRNLASFPSSPKGGFLTLAGGDDKEGDLKTDDFVGLDDGSGKRTGIQAFEDIDEISICLAPDVWAPTVHSALIQHCETLKDRFAILDPQDGLDVQGIRGVKENLDSKYAALYYPWLEVRDPFISQNVQVAPSGHVAGIYARVDVERGVHKAPANEIIRGITRIASEVTKREQDLLNPKGINALRFFPGRGNRVWGARTISSDSSWKYVNVRRLFIFVEESIDEGTQFVVFEPNAEPTWARVRQTITNFLTTVWRSGALEGTTADQAFFVKCDRTTMSQDDIDNGRLICVIGIAPVKPAEFVIFRIQQKTLESNPT